MEGRVLDGTEVITVTVVDKPGQVLMLTASRFWRKKRTMNQQGRFLTSAVYLGNEVAC